MIPVIDSFTMLSTLKGRRGDSRLRDIPVIIISAITDLKSMVRGIEKGAEDYLPKPFDRCFCMPHYIQPGEKTPARRTPPA